MKAREVFTKTMPFAWAKLLLGLVTVVISAVLFGILMGLAWLFKSDGVSVVMFLIWVSAVGVVRFIIMHYIGYMLKAGHIAVITEALATGRVPDNQISYGKQLVTARFATSNIYFAVDKLVSGAVKQIQKGIGKIGNALDFIPGMGTVSNLAQYFIELSLGYIDECCLGYTFYKKEQSAFKSAADGVVIYAQNWKTLLGSAAKTMAMVVLGIAGITLALFVVLGLLFRLFSWPGWVAFVIALLIALAVKFAFIDSFILARTMTAYMGVAPTTAITFDLYGKLSGISAKFKELLNKGRSEEPAQPQQQYAAPVQAAGGADKPVFCGQCGAKNERGTEFCGSCGAPLGQ
ncbi:MAG: zinc ribbon domain-containing protein [Oscillospiraceae bacterium]|jgi:hypothetical protein|nr:zinc ribbon domain-containing protein [Oscillospiraceae bacterium]